MADRYGVVGKNIGYSLSPSLFEERARRFGIDARYEIFDLPRAVDLVSLFHLPGLKGFNVTIPYKRAIIPYLDTLSKEAQATGVVNTVKYENGKWKGYNTDVYGFEKSLEAFVPIRIDKALIAGNGATAQSIRYVLERRGVEVTILSRRKSPGVYTYDEADFRVPASHPLIINTTPLGGAQFPGRKPPLPYEGLGPFHYLMDVHYHPPVTPFLEEGLRRGAQVKNGRAMLVFQARKSFEIWTGIPADR